MILKALRLLPLLALAASAHAQFSVYGTVTVDRISGINSSPVLSTLSPTTYKNSVNPIGFTGGGSYDFKTVGPALLSADLRGVYETSKRGAQNNSDGAGTIHYAGLGGVRATFHTPFPILRPYVLGSAGYARSNYGVLTDALFNGTVYPSSPIRPGIPTQNGLEYHVFAGLDLHFLPGFDFRLFEVGYGGIEAFGTYAHNYPLYSLSSGLVFHIPPRN